MRVIKVGGRAQRDPALAAALATAWRAAPGALVVVHGGGDEVSALQRAGGRTATFVDGRRVTAPEDIALLRMALSGASNKRVVAALVAHGIPALGLSGEDAALLVARPHADARLGAVGVPEGVDGSVLMRLLASGFLPVLSPLASDGQGGALNVNADDAAAAVAGALHADELLLVADVPAVLDGGVPVETLDADGARELAGRAAVTAGMIAKLEAAFAALAAGVAHVRVGDVTAITEPGCGTAVVPVRSYA